jgi:cation diffusion facilitator CzcD-associated flavoprotein CzcO
MQSLQPTLDEGSGLPAAKVDVLVVGAGITGIYHLHRARQAGFSARLLEAGGGVGGTWYWNRYPEARFDSESYAYAYVFSKELFEEWEWQELFAGQPEIERYLNRVVDQFALRGDIQLGRRVIRHMDGADRRWREVRGAVPGGRHRRALSAVLPGRARTPELPG